MHRMADNQLIRCHDLSPMHACTCTLPIRSISNSCRARHRCKQPTLPTTSFQPATGSHPPTHPMYVATPPPPQKRPHAIHPTHGQVLRMTGPISTPPPTPTRLPNAPAAAPTPSANLRALVSSPGSSSDTPVTQGTAAAAAVKSTANGKPLASQRLPWHTHRECLPFLLWCKTRHMTPRYQHQAHACMHF